MTMTDMYADIILEHYKHPQNKGTLQNASVSHEEYNPLCGDRIKIQLLIEGDKIKDVKFAGTGCAISIAATSMLIESIKGKSLEEIKNLDKKDIMEMLGVEVNPARVKCALIGLKTLKLAIYEYMTGRNQKVSEKEYRVKDV
jgi:nitrogen fixation NifU-like protein